MSNSQLPPPSGAPISGNVEQKNFTTSWLLSLLLGVFGADRFYLGKTGSAVAKLLTLGGFGIWYLIDLIILLTGGTRDKNGLPLKDEPKDKKKQWIISAAVIVAFLIFSAVNNANSSSDEIPAAEKQIVEEVETPSATPAPSTTPTPTTPAVPEADSAENKAYFVSSANGDLADMNKDLDDMVMRANNAQMIRLIGNVAELSFNIGQLKSLDAPSSVSAAWAEAMATAEASLDALSATSSDYAAGATDLGTMLAAIDNMRAQVANVSAVVAQVG